MAKLFGYASYEEQLKHLNKIEKQKIIQHELLEHAHAAKDGAEAQGDVEMVDDEEEEENDNGDEEEESGGNAAEDNADVTAMDTAESATDDVNMLETTSATADASVDVTREASAPKETEVPGATPAPASPSSTAAASPSSRTTKTAPAPAKRRTNHIKDDDDEDDGNDADSEQDGNGDDTALDKDDDGVDDLGTSAAPRDRAAGYRRLLQAEALRNKQRKRLKQTGDFVEAEAEEDEEEDALKIGGLGDFGFGVPQAKTQESKEAEEERKALQLREDDLDGIVDDLSDDERAQAQDLDEMFRKELEEQDRQQVKEVMRNVKEGFGRNRRAFSAGLHGAEARGRFNLDELVAADGKLEAARLGLLESDEELSDGEADGKKAKKKKKNGDDEDEEEEDDEEDEEAEMERMLRERFLNQPKIYITSSESENEDDGDAADAKGAADDNDAESDEERERQQMKLFSERARINRRMQRMKEMQRYVALERDDGDAKPDAAVPNLLLLDDDDDSHEVRRCLSSVCGSRTRPDELTLLCLCLCVVNSSCRCSIVPTRPHHQQRVARLTSAVQLVLRLALGSQRCGRAWALASRLRRGRRRRSAASRTTSRCSTAAAPYVLLSIGTPTPRLRARTLTRLSPVCLLDVWLSIECSVGQGLCVHDVVQRRSRRDWRRERSAA